MVVREEPFFPCLVDDERWVLREPRLYRSSCIRPGRIIKEVSLFKRGILDDKILSGTDESSVGSEFPENMVPLVTAIQYDHRRVFNETRDIWEDVLAIPSDMGESR